jgi:hypothetical protein
VSEIERLGFEGEGTLVVDECLHQVTLTRAFYVVITEVTQGPGEPMPEDHCSDGPHQPHPRRVGLSGDGLSYR